jgi:selenocysteine-specific elongation factor
MFTIGTAGHIDHGKSSLVKALTSIDPDRLPEEKRRGMTIDLGFAWLPLSNGDIAGIIDVPGHKDLLKNVIAGLWGISAVLLVIAADDGWMPQTEEHVRILEFFRIWHGIVVITKIDQIPDQEWLDLIEEDIRRRLRTTHLKDSPIIRVSAKEGTNIKELCKCIEGLALKNNRQRDIGKPRLHIDRVFSISGSGTVVTGTLSNGSFLKGQQVTIFPKNLRSRIRSMESYKQKVGKGRPGSRVALNLVGVEKGDLKRGDIVFGQEDQIRWSSMIDVRVELEPLLPNSLASNTKLLVYLGTREIPARIKGINKKILDPGESVLAQFCFEEPVAARIGDHFVIRRPSPPAIIGGGTVLDPIAVKHKAKGADKVLSFLCSRSNLDLAGLILSELVKNNYVNQEDLLVACNYSKSEIAEYVGLLAKEKKLVLVGQWVIDREYWQRQMDKVNNILAEEHTKHPLESGMNLSELQKVLGLPKDIFNQIINELSELGGITQDGNIASLRTHKPSPSSEEELIISNILNLFKMQPMNPPTTKELANLIPGSEYIVQFMCRQNILVALEEGILFESKHYQRIKKQIIEILASRGRISIQDTRDFFGFSRKYVLPLMKKLDKEGITLQRGDERVLAE